MTASIGEQLVPVYGQSSQVDGDHLFSFRVEPRYINKGVKT